LIFPDLPLEYWCKKYNLEVQEIECPNCGLIQKTTIPFISQENVGLMAPLHDCGPDWQGGCAVPRDIATRNRWADFVNDIIDDEED